VSTIGARRKARGARKTKKSRILGLRRALSSFGSYPESLPPRRRGTNEGWNRSLSVKCSPDREMALWSRMEEADKSIDNKGSHEYHVLHSAADCPRALESEIPCSIPGIRELMLSQKASF